MLEPEIVMAASTREWAGRLHRHVADHGGARVRATVLDPREGLREPCAVFLVDDTTSFLSRYLVDELHQRGRRVLGVYDPDDERGKGDLADLGVDAVLPRTAAPAAFVETIASLTTAPSESSDAAFDALITRLQDSPPSVDPPTPSSRLLVVGAPPGGAGATEVTVALGAAAARRNLRAILIDADDHAPCLAQRLALPLWPNLRTAVDAVAHGDGRLEETLSVASTVGVAVLAGLASPRDWADVRPAEILAVLDRLLELPVTLIANVGAVLEALPSQGPQRFGVSRAVVGRAEVLVGVGAATPIGVARLLDWTAEATGLAPAARLQLVINRAPSSGFKRAEMAEELGRVAGRAPLFLPEDARVGVAAWAGDPVPDGPFTHAVEQLAGALLPAAPRRRRWPVLARRLAAGR